MREAVFFMYLTLAALLSVTVVCASPVWPPAPASPRVKYVRQIRMSELKPHTSFIGRIGRFLGGNTPDEELSLPFNLIVSTNRMYVICQDHSVLTMINPEDNTFQQYDCDDRPMVSPIGLAQIGETVYVSDSGNATIYRLNGDDLEPWITDGLVRPTGLVAMAVDQRLVVVDTGDHRLKIFDFEGQLIDSVSQRGEKDGELNFPTFAARIQDNVLVNDTLNYQIKRFDSAGTLLSSFGEEGDGPGTFARPKGLSVDANGNIWVVDGLFDNIQIFDNRGRLLLIIGGPGQAEGEFWSPVGIAIHNDDIYIADTFNNRIQVLQYVGGGF